MQNTFYLVTYWTEAHQTSSQQAVTPSQSWEFLMQQYKYCETGTDAVEDEYLLSY